MVGFISRVVCWRVCFGVGIGGKYGPALFDLGGAACYRQSLVLWCRSRVVLGLPQEWLSDNDRGLGREVLQCFAALRGDGLRRERQWKTKVLIKMPGKETFFSADFFSRLSVHCPVLHPRSGLGGPAPSAAKITSAHGAMSLKWSFNVGLLPKPQVSLMGLCYVSHACFVLFVCPHLPPEGGSGFIF